ncbi:DUF488 domain-containing protein [Cellulomonas alba]|uniref:DUF488 family protein n=1 Tax=Cellulomonas alba TaxID=3053467 RepID=A0ABT7SBD5_9CELL|nr:DUF488 family protein [Cellulomonas alba]MDM7853491.1 DUF488 family protein [Cellulomonas alba]
MIRTARVYDHPSAGHRVLVDRLWPRGVRKDDAPFDEWLRDAAPSTELRHWYAHDPERFDGFAARYRTELADPAGVAALDRLRALAADGTLVLVTAVREVDLSHLVVLRAVLEEETTDEPAGASAG